MIIDIIKKIRNNYSINEHLLFWLGILFNFFALGNAISTLGSLPVLVPIVQGIYLAVCFLSYVKGARAFYIIAPLFLVALVFYLSFNIN